MTALVTGGSGFVGSTLVSKLLEKGESVRILDKTPPDATLDNTEFVQADIRNYEQVLEATKGVTKIFHCVAQVPLIRDKTEFWEVNHTGTLNMLNAARENNVKKIVYVSSSAIYGIPDSVPVLETHIPAPAEDYGQAKLAGEIECQRAAQDGLDVSIVRPRTVLGPGRLGIFHILFEWISEDKAVYVLSGGHNVYQFVHVEDLANACILAGSQSGSATYNIGSSEYFTMRESLQALIEHSGSTSKIRSIPGRLASTGMKVLSSARLAPFGPYHWKMYGQSFYFDTKKVETQLGWKPQWSNSDMLADSYDWYIRNRFELRQNGRSVHKQPVKQGLLKLLKWIS
jgi:nucleoside-diphosphate-sugar epimerase